MLGRTGKLYYDTVTRATWGSLNATTGRHEATTAPATLVEIGSVKDLTLTRSRPTAKQSDRGSNITTSDAGAMEVSATFKLNVRKTQEAGVAALDAANLLNSDIALAILDQADDVVGCKGLWADCKVSKFDEGQPEGDHMTYDVSIEPYDSGVDPEFVELTAA